MSDALASEISYADFAIGKAQSVNRDAGFRAVLVYCVGPPKGKLCGHCGRLPLKDLPGMGLAGINADFRCSKCGTVGYVDTRMDLSEVTPAQSFSTPSTVAVIGKKILMSNKVIKMAAAVIVVLIG